jgi:hypothetical protein
MNINRIILFLLIINFNTINSQEFKPFKSGEWLKYKISYSGWFKAGEATMFLTNDTLDNKEFYHVVAIGKTVGPINWFFKVNDIYESYFDKKDTRPYKFIRNINEGGYTKNLSIYFDHNLEKAIINNIKTNEKTEKNINANSHDLISIIYFLRRNFNLRNIDDNNEITINTFFDYQNNKMKMKYLLTEVINTTFGKIKCLKIKPYVKSGRIFKKKESLTVWVTADKNRIPIRVKADLAVGAIRVDLEAFSGLNNSFEIQFL